LSSCYLIHRPLASSELAQVRKSIINEGVQVFNRPGVRFPGETQPFELDFESKQKIYRKVFESVIQFGQKNFLGKPVAGLLSFENLNLWFYSKFRIYFDLCQIYYLREEISYFSSRYDQVIWFGSEEISDLPSNVVSKHRPARKSWQHKRMMFQYFFLSGWRAILGSLISLKKKGPVHLMIDRPDRRQAYLNRNDLSEYWDDNVLGYLMEGYRDQYVFLDEIGFPKFEDTIHYGWNNRYLKKYRGRERTIGEWIMFRAIFSFRIWTKASKIHKALMESIQKLASDTIGIENDISNQLNKLKPTHCYYIFRYLAFQGFFRRNSQFKTITTTDENGSFNKVILDAAKSKSVTTIGIQHGVVHELHPAYMLTKSDHQYSPVPDLTLVWGPNWKEILVNQGNFDPASIQITGQIRTDIIPKMLGEQEKIEVASKPIVFASQPLRDRVLRRRMAVDVFEAVKDIAGASLTVKMHPLEFDYDFFEEIAQSVGLEKYKLVKSQDLYQVLAESTMVITHTSTVGAEAVYFGKPLIILDHFREDIHNYHRQGVARMATNSKELKNDINGFLTGNIQIDQQAYDQFIQKYAFKIDGKAADRAFEITDRLGDNLLNTYF